MSLDEAGSPMPGLPAWNTRTPSMFHTALLINANPRKKLPSVLENQPSSDQLNSTKKTIGSEARASACHLPGVTPGRSNDGTNVILSCGWEEE